MRVFRIILWKTRENCVFEASWGPKWAGSASWRMPVVSHGGQQ